MRKITHFTLSCLQVFLSDIRHEHWRRLEAFGSLEPVSDYRKPFQIYRFTLTLQEGVELYSVWWGKPKNKKKERYYLLIKQGVATWIHVYGGPNDYVDVLSENSLDLPRSLTQDPAVLALIKEAVENADEQQVLEQLAGISEEGDSDFPDENIRDDY